MSWFAKTWFLVLLVWEVTFTSSQLTSSYSSNEPKKYHKKTHKKGFYLDKPYKHKDTEEFVKKLEYDSGVKEGDNALSFGLTPVNLNLLGDEEFAEDIEEGVQEEIDVIDTEFGELDEPVSDSENSTSKKEISLMHQGMYIPSAEFNSLIDGLITNVRKDLIRREMDPLYFNIYNRGVIRHSPKGTQLPRNEPPRMEKLRENLTPKPNTENNSNKNESLPLGVGIIMGLKKLKRFGNAESRKDGDVTLVRSHYFFGPLDISFIFGTVRGIRFMNTTLSSLAAHALIEISDTTNSTTLKEFITDSPMDYEIRLRGAKNRRFRTLSQSSISRLFKRGGRMEKRLSRSFKRGLRKPIRGVTNKKNNRPNRGDKGKEKKIRGETRKP